MFNENIERWEIGGFKLPVEWKKTVNAKMRRIMQRTHNIHDALALAIILGESLRTRIESDIESDKCKIPETMTWREWFGKWELVDWTGTP